MPASNYSDALEVDEPAAIEDYESSLGSDWTSLNSSVLDYKYENGRRYHAYRAGKYMLPNDEKEQNRMDMLHHLWQIHLGGRLLIAPIEAGELKHGLDLGTGTGVWAAEMGDEYPDAKFIGLDLSPIQPPWVPPNVTFSVDDVEDVWTYPENHFSLIHLRSMYGCLKDWKKIVDQAYCHLAPGGYLEIKDMDLRYQYADDDSLPDTATAVIYHDHFTRAITKLGLATTIDVVIKYMEEAGFKGITTSKSKFPIGPWPKDRGKKEEGRWMNEIVQIGFESYALALFTKTLGLTEPEARVLIDGAKDDAKNNKIHSYYEGYVVYGRKE